jgi:hypothetical protein
MTPFLVPLLPTPTNSQYGDIVDDLVHDFVVGVCGIIDPSTVRPRWQPEPALQPAFGANWVSFGLTRSEPDENAATGLTTSAAPEFILERDEIHTFLISFCGPSSCAISHQFFDGAQINQNFEAAGFQSFNVGMVSVDSPQNVSMQIHERWVTAWDVALKLRRRIRRVYEVAPIAQINGGLDNEIAVYQLSI